MLPLVTIHRTSAAIDAVAVTFIAAAGIFKKRAKTDIAPFACDANVTDHSENFSTITACNTPASLRLTPSERRPHPRAPVGEPALAKLKAENDPEKLFHLFWSNAHNRLVVENRFAFEDTVSRLTGACRFDLIEQLLEHQKALPQGRREGFILRIISLYGKVGMLDHAVKTFQEMHLFGCRRTVKSFNATLKVLSESRSVDDVRAFFEEAPGMYGIDLDDISYNIIIKFMCEMGSLKNAYLIMMQMEKAGILPDVVTYTTLISASYKHGRREIGDGLWNLMVHRRCLPNSATFNVRIQFLINRRRAWKANDLAQLMGKAGIQPDELTFNLLIKGFCLVGELEMAKRIFYAMQGRGCKPNSKIYQTMVHYLCEGKEFDLAFRLCKDAMERNWFPSTATIEKMLKGLIAISKERNAREIMNLVRNRKPSYSTYETRIFENIVCTAR